MRTLTPILLAAILAATPSLSTAEDNRTDEPTMEQRLKDRLEQSLKDFMKDMGPALDNALDDTLQFFGAFGAIDDPRHYALPEVLPNGDIIIRRYPDAPPYQAPAPEPPQGTPDNSDTVDL